MRTLSLAFDLRRIDYHHFASLMDSLQRMLASDHLAAKVPFDLLTAATKSSLRYGAVRRNHAMQCRRSQGLASIIRLLGCRNHVHAKLQLEYIRIVIAADSVDRSTRAGGAAGEWVSETTTHMSPTFTKDARVKDALRANAQSLTILMVPLSAAICQLLELAHRWGAICSETDPLDAGHPLRSKLWLACRAALLRHASQYSQLATQEHRELMLVPLQVRGAGGFFVRH